MDITYYPQTHVKAKAILLLFFRCKIRSFLSVRLSELGCCVKKYISQTYDANKEGDASNEQY